MLAVSVDVVILKASSHTWAAVNYCLLKHIYGVGGRGWC